MAGKKEILLSDESINRYGYKVLTAGIRLGNFLANPVMTYNHFYGGVYAQPIGKWDIRIEGDKLIGTPIFDEVTQLSKDCKARWEAATLNAASIGFNIITTSDDSKYISQGQSRSTVTECELIEVALVDVPANANAIRLNINFDHKSEGQISDVPLLKQEVKMDLSKVALSLGLAADASEDQVTAAVQKLRKDAQQEVIALGISKGIINDKNKANYEALAAKDIDNVRAIIDEYTKPLGDSANAEPQTLSLVEILKAARAQNQPDANDRKNWGFGEWSKNDPDGLLKMKQEDEVKYNKLALAYKP